jgi:hypothetical protein
MKKILTRQINSFWLKFTYLLFLIILLFPYYRISEPVLTGLDNSWKIALEMAYQKGFIFGKDIIYTYGPLGRLIQRVAIGTSHFELFLFDVFCFANIAFLLYMFLPKPLHLFQLFIHFILFLLVSSIYGEWVGFVLFYICIFSGLLFLQKQQHWYLVHALAMGIINFYIKANYGIIALGFIFILLIYSFVSKRLSLQHLIIYIVGSSVFLLLLAFILKTEILTYFFSSIQIIKGYNESQSFFPANRLKIVVSSYFVFGLFLLFFFSFTVRQIIKKSFSLSAFDDFFVLSCVGVCLFVLLKYAFVRADEGHLSSFVRNAPLLFLLLFFFGNGKWLKLCGWSLILFNLVSYLLFYQPVFGKITFPIIDNLRTKNYILSEYFKDIFKKNTPHYNYTYPKNVLDIIGNKTVDLVPNETSEIYLNKLNYNPRPIIQSYQAYNEYLDKKNQEKYLSATAPDFVIFGIESIDNKYAVGDETMTLVALLQRYEPIKVWQNRLLLKKKEQTKTLKLVKKSSAVWEMGKSFPLNSVIKADSSNHKLLSIIKVKTTYNWFGKLLNLFFQPPHLNIEIVTSKGEKTIYRTVPILLNKGLIVNAKMDDVVAVKQFFETGFVENKDIQSVRFDEILRRKAGFEKKIEILEEFYELK